MVRTIPGTCPAVTPRCHQHRANAAINSLARDTGKHATCHCPGNPKVLSRPGRPDSAENPVHCRGSNANITGATPAGLSSRRRLVQHSQYSAMILIAAARTDRPPLRSHERVAINLSVTGPWISCVFLAIHGVIPPHFSQGGDRSRGTFGSIIAGTGHRLPHFAQGQRS